MLEEEELVSVPLLVLANKQDLPGAANEAQISETLGLASLRDRPWSIHKTSAISGEGLNEGLDWCVMLVNTFNFRLIFPYLLGLWMWCNSEDKQKIMNKPI